MGSFVFVTDYSRMIRVKEKFSIFLPIFDKLTSQLGLQCFALPHIRDTQII